MTRPHLDLRPRNVALVVLALVFVWLACWSFADPLVAAPDEQAHILRAYALDHGQLGAPTTPPSKVNEDVTVPMSLYYTAIYPICWHTHDNVSASCSAPWPTSSAPSTISIYVDHYPPLYYALVGTATYVSHQKSGIYLMRLISSLMGAVMAALSAYVIARWSRRRTLFAGLLIAITPEAAFLSSSVNPSGFEIMTSICLWTMVAILGLEHREDPPAGLIRLLGVVATIFVLIRGLSPFWLAIAGATLVVLWGPRQSIALLRQRRDLRLAGAVVVVGGLLATTWILTQGTLNVLPVGSPVPPHDSYLGVVHLVARQVQGWIRETIGVLGWLDTELPHLVYLSWYWIALGVVVVALARGVWREKIVVALLSLGAIVVPVLIVSRQAKTMGIVWQGRDSMPLTVGAIIIALAVCGAPRRAAATESADAWSPVSASWRDRLGPVALLGSVLLLALADLASFYTNLRRYAVGRYGPEYFFLHDQGWSPPTGQLTTLALYGVATAAIAAVVGLWIWFSPSPRTTV